MQWDPPWLAASQQGPGGTAAAVPPTGLRPATDLRSATWFLEAVDLSGTVRLWVPCAGP
jgi:hypothetical protein